MNQEWISAAFGENRLAELKKELQTLQPADVAQLMEECTQKESILLYRLLPKEEATQVFAYLAPSLQETLIQCFTDRELRETLEELFVDDAVDLLEEMPPKVVERILENSTPALREEINRILRYPKDSVGSIMTTEYVRLKPGMTAAAALAHIHAVGIDKETIYTCYVLENRKLTGVVSVKSLIMAQESTPVSALVQPGELVFLHTHDDKEQAAKLFRKYDFLALPVVDDQQMLVGIVTVDDAMDVLTEETTEDIEKMAAIHPSGESYFEMSVFAHAKSRFLWLLILMISGLFTGGITLSYEQAFAAYPLLISFMPMLMDTGGNCGSQSATLMIRGMALDEIRFSDFFRVVWKEFRIAILVGGILAAVNGIRIYLIYQNTLIAGIVALSLVATVLLSKLIGSSLPFLAKRLGLDPALAASPLITTIVDICSIVIYFNLAVALLF